LGKPDVKHPTQVCLSYILFLDNTQNVLVAVPHRFDSFFGVNLQHWSRCVSAFCHLEFIGYCLAPCQSFLWSDVSRGLCLELWVVWVGSFAKSGKHTNVTIKKCGVCL